MVVLNDQQWYLSFQLESTYKLALFKNHKAIGRLSAGNDWTLMVNNIDDRSSLDADNKKGN
jgi:hypothetical protein